MGVVAPCRRVRSTPHPSYDEDDCPAIKGRLPADKYEQNAETVEALAQSYLTGDSGRSGGGDRFTVNPHTNIETIQADGDASDSDLQCCGRVSAETSQASLRRTKSKVSNCIDYPSNPTVWVRVSTTTPHCIT